MRPSDILKPYDSVLTISTTRGKIPVYKMIEEFLWIKDKDARSVRFILNKDQVDLYKSMCEQKLSGRPIRVNILKARQKGFSTFIAGLIFVKTIFTPGQSAAIVADISDHARILFEKYQFFYENLPEELKLKIIKSNVQELVVEHKNHLRSSIRVTVQGNASGRGATYQMLHLSECAFWDNLGSTLTSLLQTVSSENMESMIFLETTANGANEYKLRWDRDVSGKTPFISKFYPWFTTEDYKAKYIYDFDKPKWLVEYAEKYNLSEAQVVWLYNKWEELSEDLSALRQEFPSNPIEAFITSGNSVFNVELLQNRKEEIMHNLPREQGFFSYSKTSSADGRITISDVKFLESRFGEIKIYKEVNPLHPYVICYDPAVGGEDYNAMHVFDNYTGEQVATYHKNRCDVDECVYQMYCLGKYYNNAMATAEQNNGPYTLQLLAKCGYPFIYQDQQIEDIGTRFINKYGYKVTTINRSPMIQMFAIAFRDNPKIINDYETICEMESFQNVQTGRTKDGKPVEKAQAVGGKHDDLVMAACGYYLCRDLQRSIPYSEPVNNKKTIDQIAIEIEQKRKNKDYGRRNVYQIWD